MKITKKEQEARNKHIRKTLDILVKYDYISSCFSIEHKGQTYWIQIDKVFRKDATVI